MVLLYEEYKEVNEYLEFINDSELLNELFDGDIELFESDIALLEGAFKDASDRVQKEHGLSDKEMKKARRTARTMLGVGTAITVAGIGAIGYGLYRGIKGLVNAFKSDRKKLEKLKIKLAKEKDPEKKEVLKIKIKSLEDKIAEKKEKIKQKKEDYKNKKK